jgi:hypothetical protein
MLTPQADWALVGWSFEDDIEKGDDSYFLSLAYGTSPKRMDNVTGVEESYCPWHFWLVMQVRLSY